MENYSSEQKAQIWEGALLHKDSYGDFCQYLDEMHDKNSSKIRELSQYFREVTSKPKVNQKLYYYFLTFTLDPRLAERVGGFRESYYERVERYIYKLIQNNKWYTEYISIVREGGDDVDKHTHWHVYIVTTKYFDSGSKLGHYRKLYGNTKLLVSNRNFVPHAYHYMEKQNSQKILKHGFCGFDEVYLTKIHNSQMSQNVRDKCLIMWKDELTRTKCKERAG